MKPFKDAAGNVNWTQSGGSEYRLDDNGTELATVTFTEKGGASKTADGHWTFHVHGFLNPHVTIQGGEKNEQIARFDANMSGGGILATTIGRHFTLGGNPWQARWIWSSTGGDDLVTFNYSGFAVDGSPEGTIEIHDAGRDSPQLPLLVTLGCYLIHLIAETEFK